MLPCRVAVLLGPEAGTWELHMRELLEFLLPCEPKGKKLPSPHSPYQAFVTFFCEATGIAYGDISNTSPAGGWEV